MCEPLLLKHTAPNFVGVVFRPATVCGYVPRQRLDLSVNIPTNHAVNNSKITVLAAPRCGQSAHSRYREAVQRLLEAGDYKIANEIFNVGYQNLSIMDIAKLVKRVIEAEFPEKGAIDIVTTLTNDNRSYHINSHKIRRVLGFVPRHTIEGRFAICAARSATDH
jgi:nucleoside-diphosphate-sugar epimerase